MKKLLFLHIFLFLLLSACGNHENTPTAPAIMLETIQTNMTETLTMTPTLDIPTNTPSFCRFGQQIPEAGNPSLSIHLPIIMYHQINEFPPSILSGNPSISVSPREFEKQMEYLVSEGYQTINFSDLINYIYSGCVLPQKPILLTFDDGWIEDYTLIYPILTSLNMTGTFFPPTNWIDHDAQGLLSWDQISEMSLGGMEFGSHTMSHAWLDRISEEEIVSEITLSKQLIEEHTGKPVLVLSYPGGAFSDGVISLLNEYGYQAAVSTIYGTDQDLSEIFSLHRIGVRYDDSIAFFASRLK